MTKNPEKFLLKKFTGVLRFFRQKCDQNVTGVVYNIDHREQVSPFRWSFCAFLIFFRLREWGGERRRDGRLHRTERPEVNAT